MYTNFDAKKAVKKEIKEFNNSTKSIFTFEFDGYEKIKVPAFALLNTNRFNPEQVKGTPFSNYNIKAKTILSHKVSVNDVDGLLHAIYISNSSDVKEYIKDFLSEVDEPDEHVYGVLLCVIWWLDYLDLKDGKVYSNVIYGIIENSTEENVDKLLINLYKEDIKNESLRDIIKKL